mmetsp:Transcript_3531/g.10289  ORF Transcript_3531/g.10289 Transcript_3531/m.10289 type:complete len:220 (-) Transcript_3531:16-675(-)
MFSLAAWIISEVMEAFSTVSSAAFAFSVASGISSWNCFMSLSSASLFFSSCSARERWDRILASSVLTALLVVRMDEASCVIVLSASPTMPRWCASESFFCTSASGATCGLRTCSACRRFAGEVPSPDAALACSRAWRAGPSIFATSAEMVRHRSSFSCCCCRALAMTTSVARGCPSHGIFQPPVGGCRSLLLLWDQTCVPPSLLPNHQPSKAGPSRLSQ